MYPSAPHEVPYLPPVTAVEQRIAEMEALQEIARRAGVHEPEELVEQ